MEQRNILFETDTFEVFEHFNGLAIRHRLTWTYRAVPDIDGSLRRELEWAKGRVTADGTPLIDKILDEYF